MMYVAAWLGRLYCSESVGMVFDGRGGITVAYEFGVVHGFDTTVGECCW